MRCTIQISRSMGDGLAWDIWPPKYEPMSAKSAVSLLLEKKNDMFSLIKLEVL